MPLSWDGLTEPVTTLLAETFALDSEAVGKPFRIWVSQPLQPAPPQGHRTLYLLDGRSYFAAVTEITRIMSVSQEICPLMVIGIGYDDPSFHVQAARRTFDLTLTADGPLSRPAPAGAGLDTGGADRLLDFIAEELRPAVTRRWPSDPSHTLLVGHSLGGLAVLHAALARPHQHQAHVAVSPALWADPEAIGQELEAGPTPQRLYAAAGELEIGAPDRNILADLIRLRGRFQEPAMAGIDARFEVLAGETHATAIYAALPPALRWTLRDAAVDTAFDLTMFRPPK
jgi:predicted alpha/beta superfamily hydrolase